MSRSHEDPTPGTGEPSVRPAIWNRQQLGEAVLLIFPESSRPGGQQADEATRFEVAGGPSHSVIVPGAELGRFLERHEGRPLVCVEGGLDRLFLRWAEELERLGEPGESRRLWNIARRGSLHDLGVLARVMARVERLPADRREVEIERGVSSGRLTPEDARLVRAESNDGRNRPRRSGSCETSTHVDRRSAAFDSLRGICVEDFLRRAHEDQAVAFSLDRALGELSRRPDYRRAIRSAIALGPARATGLRIPRDQVDRIRILCEAIYRGRSQIIRNAPEEWRIVSPSERLSGRRSRSEVSADAPSERRGFRIRDGFEWDGDRIARTDAGLPRKRTDRLRDWLEAAVPKVSLTGDPFDLPRACDGRLSTLPEDWGRFAPAVPALRAWIEMQVVAEAMKAIRRAGSHGDVPIHPRYEFDPGLVVRGPDLERLRGLLPPDVVPIVCEEAGARLVVLELPDLRLRCHAALVEGSLGDGSLPLAEMLRGEADLHAELARRLRERIASLCASGRLNAGDFSRLTDWPGLARRLTDCLLDGRGSAFVRDRLAHEVPLDLGVLNADALYAAFVAEAGGLGWFEHLARRRRTTSPEPPHSSASGSIFLGGLAELHTRVQPEEWWDDSDLTDYPPGRLGSDVEGEDGGALTERYHRSVRDGYHRVEQSIVPLVAWAYGRGKGIRHTEVALGNAGAATVTAELLFELAAAGQRIRAVAGTSIVLDLDDSDGRQQTDRIERLVDQVGIRCVGRVPIRHQIIDLRVWWAQRDVPPSG